MERETRIKRLIFRSAHRGSKETDLVLGPFALAALPAMGEAELVEFEEFLDENDADIWDWVSGKSDPEGGRYIKLIGVLRKNYALS